MAVASPMPMVAIFALFQLALLLLYVFLVEFPEESEIQTSVSEFTFAGLYNYWVGVHIFLLIGIGFLASFLRKYSLTAVAYNYLLVAFALQWTILVYHLWQRAFEEQVQGRSMYDRIQITTKDLVVGDFGALTVLISFGAVMGKAGPAQLLVMAIIEIIISELNNAIAYYEYEAIDVGGATQVHLFGAIFGIMAAKFYMSADEVKEKDKDNGLQRRATFAHSAPSDQLYVARNNYISSNSTTDTFGMIGTLFLAVFFPALNASMTVGYARERVVIGTVLAMCASTTMAFTVSAALRGGKFSMADIQAATLAGGVIIGGVTSVVSHVWVFILLGMLAGVLTVAGFVIFTPILEGAGIHDTRGVFWLHGLPGFVAGIASCISQRMANGTTIFGQSIGVLIPARMNDDRIPSYQSAMQVSMLFTTIGMALAGGILAGIVMRFVPNIGDDEHPVFDDARYWEELAEGKKNDDDIPLEIDA